MNNFGLAPLPEDKRDFSLGSIFTFEKPEDLPDEFELKLPYPPKDQKGSDFCTAYASCGMSELQEDEILEPAFSFAMSKEISGGVEVWGQDLRSAMSSHVKYGALQSSLSLYSVDNKDPDWLREPQNWDAQERVMALNHKKKSYFKVVGQYDAFDDIRLAIHKFQDKKQAVILGVEWGWGLDTFKIDEKKGGFGHAIYAYGWFGNYILIRNSYGNSGKGGSHAIHRDIINEYADKYGAFMLVDMDQEEAKSRIKYGIIDTDNWLIRLWKRIWVTS